MTCNEVVSLILDIVIAGAAITASVVAVLDLGEWKVQLKGKENHRGQSH